MSRIFMHNYDDFGCGHYRCALPTFNCYGDLAKNGTSLSLQRDLTAEELFYDAYILHRNPPEPTIFFLQKVMEKGKKFVIELDDDIFSTPEWMPTDEFKSTKWALKKALDIASEVWVATPQLAEVINKPEKTHVLPNLVDFNAFQKPKPPAPNTPIRVLWMGSNYHDKDLEQVVDPVLRLMSEYGDAVQFLFWGCLPAAFAEFTRVPGQNYATMSQKAEYGTKLLFLEGVPFKHYYDRLIGVTPAIGLCPLYDCKYSHSKTNLKFLEYSMAGAATVVTDLTPYNCVDNGRDGLKVKAGDADGWYKAIKTLIDDAALRQELVKNAREKVYEEYSWQSQSKKQVWLEAFQRLV